MNIHGIFSFLFVFPFMWSAEPIHGRPTNDSPHTETDPGYEYKDSYLTDLDVMDDSYFDMEENEYPDDVYSYDDLSLDPEPSVEASNSTDDLDAEHSQSKEKILNMAGHNTISDNLFSMSTSQNDKEEDQLFENMKTSIATNSAFSNIFSQMTTVVMYDRPKSTEFTREESHTSTPGIDVRDVSKDVMMPSSDEISGKSTTSFLNADHGVSTIEEMSVNSYNTSLLENISGNLDILREISSSQSPRVVENTDKDTPDSKEWAQQFDLPLAVGVLDIAHGGSLLNVSSGSDRVKESVENSDSKDNSPGDTNNKSDDEARTSAANIVIPKGGVTLAVTNIADFSTQGDVYKHIQDSEHKQTHSQKDVFKHIQDDEHKQGHSREDTHENSNSNITTATPASEETKHAMPGRGSSPAPDITHPRFQTSNFIHSSNSDSASTVMLHIYPTAVSTQTDSDKIPETLRSNLFTSLPSLHWEATTGEQRRIQDLQTSLSSNQIAGDLYTDGSRFMTNKVIEMEKSEENNTELKVATTQYTPTFSSLTRITTDSSHHISSMTSSTSAESEAAASLPKTDSSLTDVTHSFLVSSSKQLKYSSTNTDSVMSVNTVYTRPRTEASVSVTEPTKELTEESMNHITVHHVQKSDTESSISTNESTDHVADTNITDSQIVDAGNRNTTSLSRAVANQAEDYPILKGNNNPATVPEDTDDSPSLFVELRLAMSWAEFCQLEALIRVEIAEMLQDNKLDITADQVQLMSREKEICMKSRHLPEVDVVSVQVYLINKSFRFDRTVTLACASLLVSGQSLERGSVIGEKLLNVQVLDVEGADPVHETSIKRAGTDDDSSSNPFSDPGITLAVSLAVVGGCCCAGLIILQIVARQRGTERRVVSKPRKNRSFSVISSGSIQLSSVSKSRPVSGLYNLGLDVEDPMMVMNPLNFIQLSKFCMEESKIVEEFQKLPNQMPRLSVVPPGDEDKNRYANILPLVHSRVNLQQNGPEPRSSYINANFVAGPNNQSKYYIATQAPTEKTISDFWAMIWQQGCQVIVMLTQIEEEGQEKCSSYWPELAGKSAAQRHGDFLIELKQKDVHQEYIASVLEINNLREIESRQLYHFWYTCWPSCGTPEPISLVKLVLDTRPKYESGVSPLVVHCSPGTGRTCTFIALDMCMRHFESERVVDVARTVCSVRKERAGAVQNKEQYILLYNAIQEYATVVVSPVISAASSATTLHALLPV